jgi:hypothetical protein
VWVGGMCVCVCVCVCRLMYVEEAFVCVCVYVHTTPRMYVIGFIHKESLRNSQAAQRGPKAGEGVFERIIGAFAVPTITPP